ncbi:MAG: cytochrome P450 [Ktedonobacteraceae bacterium]|nr:cytochrome P450 [Ktedonobacteraceae bacterium]
MQYTKEERLLNPFPWYDTMRKTDPIHFYEQYGIWQAFRYNDVQRVLSDYAAFSSNFGGPGEDPLSTSLISMDPPRHRQLRNIVTQAFTPRSVAKLSERITAIVTELLDKVAATGRMDIIDDFSYPLPVIVIAEMLGIPQEDRERFKHWSDAIVGATSSGGANPQQEMGAYFLDMIAQRRENSEDDLISALLTAQIDGVHLDQRELLGFCILLLVAGNETTTNLIGNALLCFDEYPETMDQLRAEPDLLPTAIEEVLRYRSPVQLMYRHAVSDVELGDHTIRAGQMIMAQIGSANRDEAQFPNADTFDIRRTPNRHIAFGHGIHFCLGAPLARLEAKIALALLLERFQDIQRVGDIPLETTGSDIVYGVKHLPITFRA